MNTDDLKVSIIIPVLYLKRPRNLRYFYSRKYTLKEVLDDLSANVTLSHENIVICNSRDHELIDFIQHHPAVDKFCLNSTNVGVARSWNMGAQMAEGRALCYLNDDVHVGKNAVEILYEKLFSKDEIGMVGPKGAKWKGAEHDRFVGQETMEEADAISGFMFMMETDFFRSIGGFDINYTPAGFEEIDMSYKIKAAGKKCFAIPKLDVHHYHEHGVSASNVTISYLNRTITAKKLHSRNKAYFIKKWKIGDA